MSQPANQTRQSNQPTQQSAGARLPDDSTMLYATKLALKESKPIHLTYWLDSLNSKVVIYTDKKTNERVILKDKEEYTSPIVQKYNNKGDCICCTENSIYIVAETIKSI
jgi:hypothetical protein